MDNGDYLVELFGTENPVPVFDERAAEFAAVEAEMAARVAACRAYYENRFVTGDVLAIIKTHNYLAQNKGG